MSYTNAYLPYIAIIYYSWARGQASSLLFLASMFLEGLGDGGYIEFIY